MFDELARAELKLSLLSQWLAGRPPLTRAGFAEQFEGRLNYFFLAHP